MKKDCITELINRKRQPAEIISETRELPFRQEPARPEGYRYLEILKNHLGGDLSRIFNGELIYPRQLEVHLPGDGEKACNFNCAHCQGRKSKDALGLDARTVVDLLNEVAGLTKYVVFGGQYTEPTLNPLLIDCIEAVKRGSSDFGITTNGSMFKELEDKNGFISRLTAVAGRGDYITVSLDAGLSESHRKSKRSDRYYFDDIIKGIETLCLKRNQSPNPLTIRICYLLNKWNSSIAEIENIIGIAKQLQVDSLRFSIPYAIYGMDFAKVRQYKNTVERRHDLHARVLLAPYLSETLADKPYIFYFGPHYQDVDRMSYKRCIHSYYQITLGADGWVYKCSSIAQPLFKFGRLGKTPENRRQLEELILKNHDNSFDCNTCFRHGARCNRIALENNFYYNNVYLKSLKEIRPLIGGTAAKHQKVITEIINGG